MNREERVDAVARLLNGDDRAARAVVWLLASSIVDALLPQVSTVEELEALDGLAVVMNPEDGLCSRANLFAALTMLSRGPLTVVWRPES